MIFIDKLSRTPVYEQVYNQICKQILTGVLNPDDQLPSVRALANEISVNPNTLQKAYTKLDEQNICYSVSGIGRFVNKNAAEIINQHKAYKFEELAEIVGELKDIGVSCDVVSEYIIKLYDNK